MEVAAAEFISTREFNVLSSVINRMNSGQSVTCKQFLSSVKRLGVDVDSILAERRVTSVDLQSTSNGSAVPGFRRSNEFFTMKIQRVRDLIGVDNYSTCSSRESCIAASYSKLKACIDDLEPLEYTKSGDLTAKHKSLCFSGGVYTGGTLDINQLSLDIDENCDVSSVESSYKGGPMKINASDHLTANSGDMIDAIQGGLFHYLFPGSVAINLDDHHNLLVDIDGKGEQFFFGSVFDFIDMLDDGSGPDSALILEAYELEDGAAFDSFAEKARRGIRLYELSALCSELADLVFEIQDVIADFLIYISNKL